MKLHLETRLVHGCKNGDPHTGAMSFPIYQSATFKHPGPNQSTGYDYTRTQNPTREEMENTIAILEGGKAGFAFSSGMAAISTVLALFAPGDHLVVSDDLYGGTYRLFEKIYRGYGLDFTYADTSLLSNVEAAIKPNTRGLFVETPSNPMMKVTDLQGLVEIARTRKLLTIIDNTFLTPYFQRPLELGADIVVHSGTKYLGGHNDTLAGLIATGDEQIAERLKFIQNSVGAVLSPFDSWLILRGIKTLGIRLERQQANAFTIAYWLREHPEVERVYYPGLTDHENHEVLIRQSSGFGGMISFTLRDPALIENVLSRVKVISFAESLGGVESLITYPIVQTHADIPEEIRERLGVNNKLLRLSVGIESVDDLIADLEQAITS
jgi:cystathionine gamma-synthase